MNQTLLIVLVAVGISILIGFLMVFLLNFVNKKDKNKAYRELLDDVLVYDDEDDEIELRETWLQRWDKYWTERFKAVNTEKYSENPTIAGREAMFLSIGLGVVISLVVRNPIAGIFVAVVVLYILAISLKNIADKNAMKLDHQLPGFLAALKANVQANETPERAILKITDTMPSPLREELNIAKQSIQASNKFSDALLELKTRTKSKNLAFLCSCIIQANNSGANLEKQIGVIEEILRNRREINDSINREVRATTPAIWLSSLIIPGVFVLTLFMSPESREFWFKDPISWVALGGVIVLYLLGIWLTKRLTDAVRNL